MQPGELRPQRLRTVWLIAGLVVALGAVALGVLVGPASLGVKATFLELADRLPFVDVHSGLTDRQTTILWELRMPRVVLGLLVGSMLAVSGGTYQGVFRNPLADPHLLGVAAGAGLGATLAIVAGADPGGDLLDAVPVAAFLGALAAVTLTYVLGGAGSRFRSPAALLLAGVAVASLLTAVQTFIQQQHTDTIQSVYAWVLGRLTTAGWDEVTLLLPYVVVTAAVLLAHRRVLDVMSVGDDEAGSLGVHPERTRMILAATAALGTAAAVAVSGLIGFVGIIVPHTIRLVGGTSYRVIMPLSLLIGGAFLVVADVIARTVLSPAEVPIGVVTAMFGAPFFLVVLRTRQVVGT